MEAEKRGAPFETNEEMRDLGTPERMAADVRSESFQDSRTKI